VAGFQGKNALIERVHSVSFFQTNFKFKLFEDSVSQSSYLLELQMSNNQLIENKFRIRLEKFNDSKQKIESKKASNETLNKLEKWAKFDRLCIKHSYVENGARLVEIFKQIVNMLIDEKQFSYSFDLKNNSIGSLALQTVNKILRRFLESRVQLAKFFHG
jgi:hypothetical protein